FRSLDAIGLPTGVVAVDEFRREETVDVGHVARVDDLLEVTANEQLVFLARHGPLLAVRRANRPAGGARTTAAASRWPRQRGAEGRRRRAGRPVAAPAAGRCRSSRTAATGRAGR